MTDTILFACRNPSGAHWHLGPTPGVAGQLLLIGWRQIPSPLDAGVPQSIAAVLTQALTSVARVTFPCSTAGHQATSTWTPFGGDLIRSLGSGGFAGQIGAALAGSPAEIMLISTQRPETALRLFDDTGYPWWLQGQVALLSTTDGPAPVFDRKTLLALLDEDWMQRAVSLAATGITGVLRPGVDGDTAGILSLTEGFESIFLATLERQARQAGFDWALLPEDRFTCFLAASGQ